MNNAKLLLIGSKKEIEKDTVRECILKKSSIYTIGRENIDDLGVDLTFDGSISRRHFEIWFEGNSWWIKDTSRYGTKINNKKIPRGERIKLEFDDEISIGNETVLVLIPTNRIYFC